MKKHLANSFDSLRFDLINKLESENFKVKNELVYKHSKKARGLEVAGQLNNVGVYFHASNVSPFKQGTNTFKDVLNSNYIYTATTSQIFKEVEVEERVFSFEDYIKSTKSKNHFTLFSKNLKKKFTNSSNYKCLYDLRGVSSGALQDATLFPYINYNSEFITAKIVKYNSNTGKRLKTGYVNNWFHAEKNILKSLGVENKVKTSINCFFGEHLLKDSTNPVVIVEAEKTAVLLSLFFKNIDFIATGGINKLKVLDYSFLHNRDVFIYPDNNANEWFDIAKERNWFCSDVIENYANAGEDIADYLIKYVNKDLDANSQKCWFDLSKELLDINKKNKLNNKNESLNFGFSVKKKPNINNVVLAFPKESNSIYYTDTSNGYNLKCINFIIYEKDFTFLNCNPNINKMPRDANGGLAFLSEKQMLSKLEKIYRIHKYLNKDLSDHLEEFKKALYNIVINSNYNFNVDYIVKNLIPVWDLKNSDVWSEYAKKRNWIFKSKNKIDSKDFILRINEDKALFRMHVQSRKFYNLIKNNKFIDAENLGLKRKEDNVFLWDLVKKYNISKFGVSTAKMYKNTLIVKDYINMCFNLYTTYTTNIECAKKSTQFENSQFYPNIKQISDNTNLTRRAVKNIIDFKRDYTATDEIINTLYLIISNPQSFDFTRTTTSGRKRLVLNFIKPTFKQEIPLVSNKDAFNSLLDTSNSVLNCDESNALNKGIGFYISWYLFNNKSINSDSDYERSMIYSHYNYLVSEPLQLVA